MYELNNILKMDWKTLSEGQICVLLIELKRLRDGKEYMKADEIRDKLKTIGQDIQVRYLTDGVFIDGVRNGEYFAIREPFVGSRLINTEFAKAIADYPTLRKYVAR